MEKKAATEQSIKVPNETLAALRRMAAQRSLETGKFVSVSSLVKSAIADALVEQHPAQE